jgi:hypothetical protein
MSLCVVWQVLHEQTVIARSHSDLLAGRASQLTRMLLQKGWCAWCMRRGVATA